MIDIDRTNTAWIRERDKKKNVMILNSLALEEENLIWMYMPIGKVVIQTSNSSSTLERERERERAKKCDRPPDDFLF